VMYLLGAPAIGVGGLSDFSVGPFVKCEKRLQPLEAQSRKTKNGQPTRFIAFLESIRDGEAEPP
jgi:hypothetical protein